MSALPTMTRDVLSYLQERERPATVDEIVRATGVGGGTVRKILSRMLRTGRVEHLREFREGRVRVCYRAGPTTAMLLAAVLAHHAAERQRLLTRCLQLEARIAEREGR